MEGNLIITYTVICDGDIYVEMPLKEVLANEKIQAAIKREFGQGGRNLVLDDTKTSGTLIIEKEKQHYTLVIPKDDFADALTLAEEDARKNKRLKGECSMVELLDIANES